ncbi:exopolysaccharide biosynthesis polyprenyl glycosylphosphotransferase [Desulfobotulus alkaliphilus]|uniref:Exopolysaccharide biosynthesis polyprenyl glycosylphosphotransferase n=1 Tax=Desulfobotulus alkaliphilus TaxID=622671 RepID=A0A562RGJ8_9BACT|nr:sugar transferase [Desulfobotulus alkaliphilus]TWI68195.1 exopolysaccharide biosynthesis polyprenyl glycosylphosphotransferase [Desulfobotulus alkaliphilus]
MLRENARAFNGLHRLTDLFLTALAFGIAYLLKIAPSSGVLGGLSRNPDYGMVFFIILAIWYLVFDLNNNYAPFRERNLLSILLNLYKSILFSFMVFSLVIYLLKIEHLSRSLMLIFLALNVGILTLSKVSVFYTLARIRRKGYNYKNILVVGSRTRAEKFIRSVLDKKDAGYRISGCLDTDHSYMGKQVVGNICVTGCIEDLKNILENEVVDELVFAMPLKKIDNADAYIAMAEDMGVKCRIIPDWQLHYLMYKPDTATIRFETFLGTPSMALHMITNNDRLLVYKYFFDYVFCLVAFALLLPFFILTAAAIKLFSKGPVFYKQKRIGLHGRVFEVYKFRTMVVDADKMLEQLKDLNEADGPAFKIRKDPRVIPWVGTFLRKTSLDELPQIINILRGEMSLVGPRPPLPNEVAEYEIWQRRRLSMKPGLTCIWQIAPERNDIRFDEWMKMDLHYIDNWSMWLDFTLIFRTIKSVLTGAGR